jgi:uncharacterized membrane protein YbjE (DUF340 family)
VSSLTTLLYLMVPLVIGIVSGYLLRNKKQMKLEKVSLVIIVVLIFTLGFSIGSNNELLKAMPQVGLQALVIAVLAILFSILFVMAGRRLVKAQ